MYNQEGCYDHYWLADNPINHVFSSNCFWKLNKRQSSSNNSVNCLFVSADTSWYLPASAALIAWLCWWRSDTSSWNSPLWYLDMISRIARYSPVNQNILRHDGVYPQQLYPHCPLQGKGQCGYIVPALPSAQVVVVWGSVGTIDGGYMFWFTGLDSTLQGG